MRPYPCRFPEHLALAKALKLPNPEGRALYACNRQQSGGMKWTYETSYSAAETMTKCLPATADRWLEHFRNGGSIRSLKYSHEEFNKERRERDGERRRLYPVRRVT
jgi:hypothetical protein